MTLALRSRAELAQSAALAGIALTTRRLVPPPFILVLAMAFLALKRELPTYSQFCLMQMVAARGNELVQPSSEQLPLRLIRTAVQEGFAAMGEGVPLPVGLWNTARGLILTGEAAWNLPPEQAAYWGSYPSYPNLKTERAQNY